MLVDLSDCEFIDSSVMNALVLDAERRELDEHQLELVVPDWNHRVAVALRLTSLDHFFAVHEPLVTARQRDRFCLGWLVRRAKR